MPDGLSRSFSGHSPSNKLTTLSTTRASRRRGPFVGRHRSLSFTFTTGPGTLLLVFDATVIHLSSSGDPPDSSVFIPEPQTSLERNAQSDIEAKHGDVVEVLVPGEELAVLLDSDGCDPDIVGWYWCAGIA